MRRCLIALLLVLLLGVALPLSAAEPNPSLRQKELIEKLLLSMNADKMFDKLMDSMYGEVEKQFLKQAEANGHDPDQLAEAKEVFTAFREKARKMDIASLLRDAQIRIYAKYFTEAELADLVAFYASPTGQKSIQVMPQLMSEGMQMGMRDIGPKIEAVMATVVEEQEQKRPWRRTMKDMRQLATAIEAYQTDQDDETFPPAGDMASLKESLKGVSMPGKFPEKDMWGTPYEYVVSADRHHYRILSAGADKSFEWDSRRIESTKHNEPRPVRYRENPEDDIIFGNENGSDSIYIQVPMQAKPKAAAAN